MSRKRFIYQGYLQIAELDIPVKYIGVGETIDDLQKFDADAFVNALFDIDEKDLHTEE